MSSVSSNIVLKCQDLHVEFKIRKYFRSYTIKALRGVDVSLSEGEILSVVGESGCGKTTLLRTVAMLYQPSRGRVVVLGRDLTNRPKTEDIWYFRRNVQMVFQDPFASLNPTKRVEYILQRPLIVHQLVGKRELRHKLLEVLNEVELTPPEDFLTKFPHELSGGQKQRVGFARAIITKPKIILADEPTSMLDVSIKSGILNLMLKLREDYRVSFLHVTHDLAAAKYVSDRIVVMYAGMIVEDGDAKELVENPLHPYTQLLKEAAPDPIKTKVADMRNIGEPPNLVTPPPGCPFEPRCKFRKPECRQPVALRKVDGRNVRCVLY